MQNWKKGCVFGHIDKFWKWHERQIKKNACKNIYLGSIFIPEKYVIRVHFVSPWTSLIPHLAIRVAPPGHFDPGMGLKLGRYLGFLHNQYNRVSSGAYVTCIYCSLTVKINMCWNATQRVKLVDAFVLRLFLRVWSAKTRIPHIWAPWLTTPLHSRVVYKVWDLPCISAEMAVLYINKKMLEIIS